MIASWPQAALRGGTTPANASCYGPVCSIRGPATRRVRQVSPQQKAEAGRLQVAAPELSTLPETWERTSLSDEGIREALRARTKHFAALDEPELADSGSMSPRRSASRVTCFPYRQCSLQHSSAQLRPSRRLIPPSYIDAQPWSFLCGA